MTTRRTINLHKKSILPAWLKGRQLETQRLFTLLLFFFSISLSAFSQNTSTDQSKIFSLTDYFQAIRFFHPVAKQIDLLETYAKANLQKAFGNFDPKLYATYDDKFFDKKNYWRQFEGGVKIPTRLLGLEIKGGFSFNDGTFLNPENKLPKQGQAVLGISLPVLQGLFIDQARASLQQAKIFLQITTYEQILQMNDLLYEASLAYWEWAYAYENYQLLDAAVNNSRQKFEAVKNTFQAGDYAGIDTLEAFIQVQNFQLARQEASIAYQHAQLSVGTYLWNEDNFPIILTQEIVPENLTTINPLLEPQIDSVEININRLKDHPILQQYQFKLAQLEVDRRLKVEKFKPKLDINYNVLTPESAFGESPINSMKVGQNYKWGVSLGFPLFLRKARGDLQATQIKIQQTNLQQEQKRLQLENKIRAYFNEINILKAQMEEFENMINNYQRMLNGETSKFEAGESSLFLLNSREMKLIEAQQKQLKLKFKYVKAKMTLAWVEGVLI